MHTLRCKVSRFHSKRGTLGYNMWKLIYEQIETSSTNDLLKLLYRYCCCCCAGLNRRRTQQPSSATAPATLTMPDATAVSTGSGWPSCKREVAKEVQRGEHSATAVTAEPGAQSPSDRASAHRDEGEL